MPRDGSGVYHRPPGTDAVTDTSIESTKYNGNVADVEQDLNTPRPIIAGGTGANNSHDAMIALGGEIAEQIVDNYDTFAFRAGSFSSVPGATSAPLAGSYFSGVCHVSAGGVSCFLEARTYTAGHASNGPAYVREKNAGLWGPWVQQTGASTDYVAKAGDTMTGPLTATNIQSTGNIGAGASGVGACGYFFSTGGTHFLTYDNPSGNYSLAGGNYFVSNPYIVSNQGPNTGTYYFGNSAAAYLNHVPGAYNFGGADQVTATQFVSSGNTVAGGSYYAGYSQPTGAIFFSSTQASLGYASGAFAFSAPVSMLSGFTATSSHFVRGGPGGAGAFYNSPAGADRFWCGTDDASDVFRIYAAPVGNVLQIDAPTGLANFLHGVQSTGYITVNGLPCGYGCKEGTASVNGPDYFNFFWNGAGLHAYVNTTYLGALAFSDYRIKKDVADLPDMWETVKALRPIKYTQAQFSPPSHIKHVASETLKAREEAENNPEAKPREVASGPMFEADDIERWGFVAHELQETLTGSAATGEKDSPDTIQSPNPFTVIAALTKALQEAMARIEALEGAAQPAR